MLLPLGSQWFQDVCFQALRSNATGLKEAPSLSNATGSFMMKPASILTLKEEGASAETVRDCRPPAGIWGSRWSRAEGR